MNRFITYSLGSGEIISDSISSCGLSDFYVPSGQRALQIDKDEIIANKKVVNGLLASKTPAEIEASRPTPPDEKIARWDQIKEWRDTFEQSPLATSYGTFDADEKSLKRMELALEAFDSLPTLVNGRLTWKLADNSLRALTKMELEDVFDQLKVNIAARAAVLHVQAELFAASPPTVGHIKNPVNWGI